MEIAETTKEIVIKTELERVIARMNLKGAVLHGHCEWYDGWGDLVAYGFFKNGSPFTGTFLNWAKFLGQLRRENPFDGAVYCRDWVTVFEASFASDIPKYEMVIEAYYRGKRVLVEA